MEKGAGASLHPPPALFWLSKPAFFWPSTGWCDQPCTIFATSAAKSSSFFSTPSPTITRAKPVISTPASEIALRLRDHESDLAVVSGAMARSPSGDDAANGLGHDPTAEI